MDAIPLKGISLVEPGCSVVLQAAAQVALCSLLPCCADDDAVVLKGDFAWDLETGPSLSELDLKVPVGSLVTIVGQTGSGKSSVLAAALGLMNQVSGPPPEVHGKVSNYSVSQGRSGAELWDLGGALPLRSQTVTGYLLLRHSPYAQNASDN